MVRQKDNGALGGSQTARQNRVRPGTERTWPLRERAKAASGRRPAAAEADGRGRQARGRRVRCSGRWARACITHRGRRASERSPAARGHANVADTDALGDGGAWRMGAQQQPSQAAADIEDAVASVEADLNQARDAWIDTVAHLYVARKRALRAGRGAHGRPSGAPRDKACWPPGPWRFRARPPCTQRCWAS